VPETTQERSYGCSYGCGNPYDYLVVCVADGTTEFLCIPCFLRLAESILTAVIDPSDPTVQAAVNDMGTLDTTPMRNGKVKSRGKNAPVGTDDDDLLEAFDTVITADDLPPEFR
jgi:hypothetical protein